MSTFNERGSEPTSTAVSLDNAPCHGRRLHGGDLGACSRDEIFAMPEKELMSALQTATENAMRLTGENIAAKRRRARGPVGDASLEHQHLLAQHLINRLLATSAAHADLMIDRNRDARADRPR